MTQSKVIFDDSCDKCTNWAKFIKDRDPTSRIRIIGQNSSEGNLLLERRPLNLVDTDSVFFLSETGIWYSKSSAVWRICSKLRFPWPIATILLFIPIFIRDYVYDHYSRRRNISR